MNVEPGGAESGGFSLFNPRLDDLASLTEEDFRRLFAHSPIKRAKYRGWLRNLCVTMGNSGDRRFVPRLERLAQDDDPLIREHAQWAIERLRAALECGKRSFRFRGRRSLPPTRQNLVGGGMRMIVSTLLALGISLPAALRAGPRVPAATPSSAADSALRKLDETSLAGIRKREVKFVDAVYAPDVVMFPAYGQLKVEGLDLVRDAWKSLYDTFATITRCEWSERRYHASGNQAWMTCLWYLEGSNSDGQALQLVLRVTRHYENRRGRWLVVHEHISAPMR